MKYKLKPLNIVYPRYRKLYEEKFLASLKLRDFNGGSLYVLRLLRYEMGKLELHSTVMEPYSFNAIVNDVKRLDNGDMKRVRQTLIEIIGDDGVIDFLLNDDVDGMVDHIRKISTEALSQYNHHIKSEPLMYEFTMRKLKHGNSGVALSDSQLMGTNLPFILRKYSGDVVIVPHSYTKNGYASIDNAIYTREGGDGRYGIANQLQCYFETTEQAIRFTEELDYSNKSAMIYTHNVNVVDATKKMRSSSHGLSISERKTFLTEDHIAYLTVVGMIANKDTPVKSILDRVEKVEKLSERCGVSKPLIEVVEVDDRFGIVRAVTVSTAKLENDGVFIYHEYIYDTGKIFNKKHLVSDLESSLTDTISAMDESDLLYVTVIIPISVSDDIENVARMINRGKLTKQIDTNALHLTLLPYIDSAGVDESLSKLIKIID